MSELKLKVTDTLESKKKEFVPLEQHKVKMYVCGVTPYDFSHIGHGRVYVTFDILFRLLKFLGYNVTYCRNFTDIDDKLLNKAQAEFGDQHKYTVVADKFIASFKENMQQLNCQSPTAEPKVTDNIPEIIAFIEGLIANGKAYESQGDVYFHVRSFPEYGKLSKRDIEDLKAGARVEINEKKKDPLDFALWKSEPNGEFWQSPWGYGRPGWHIECSALAKKFLGEQIDIHAGGMDLIFPHHENEIAQSEGLSAKQFSNYWMHNAFVRINKEKMSKSLGNFFTLNDVFKQFNPDVIRFYYISHSYNSPLDFSFDDIEVAQKVYQRLAKIFDAAAAKEFTVQQVMQSDLGKKMVEFLSDDLNTPGLLGLVFEHLKSIENNAVDASMVKFILQSIVGLRLIPLEEKVVEITPEIEQLLNEREQARIQKDWAKADELRDRLKVLGYEPKDKKL